MNDLNILALYKSEIISRLKLELTSTFEIVDIGPLAFYIGLNVT